MSFSLTTEQFLDGSKDVTRRVGWRFLKAGDRVRAVKKCMGLKPGEKVESLGEIEIVDVRREPLDAIDAADVRREGFPDFTAAEFVEMFCRHMRVEPEADVTRIEFRKLCLEEMEMDTDCFVAWLRDQITTRDRTPGVESLIDYTMQLREAATFAHRQMCDAGVPDDGSHRLSHAMVELRRLTR